MVSLGLVWLRETVPVVGGGGRELLGPSLGKWTLLPPREWESRIRRGHTQDPRTGVGEQGARPGQPLVSLRTDKNGSPTAQLPRAALAED